MLTARRPALTAARVALAAAKEALADAHAALAELSDRFEHSDEPVYNHSAIAFCDCGTAKAYRAAKTAIKTAIASSAGSKE